MKQKALEKFLRYVKINTQSEYDSDSFPSTTNQFDLANLLVEELKVIGLKDAHVDEFGYVMATLPANVNEKVPTIGFLAHLDTSPEVPGENVRPQVIDKYKGGDIVINKELNIIIKESENKDLKKCNGHTIVTSDGTTLLGADDKAGIAAIMTMVQELIENPKILHGEIKIAFTPDEETGKGVKHFNLEKFKADYAYTVDGGQPGEINKETFSADTAVIEINGRNIHPGKAKDIMTNSVRVMGDIISRLPKEIAPETTEGYEPFIHPVFLEGGVEKSTLKLFLRDFKTGGLGIQKQILEKIINDVQKLHPKAEINLEITETYRNMREELEKHPKIIENLWLAVQMAGVQPEWKPVRGGTDGSRLSALGLPTPNIFTGSSNHHSQTEWLSVDALVKTVETLVNLVSVRKPM